MPNPPFFFDAFGVGPRNATFRISDFDQPAPSTGPGRKRQPEGPGPILSRMAVWAVGAAGYLGLLLAAHGSRHANDLRAAAIVWPIAFIALNAFLILHDGQAG